MAAKIVTGPRLIAVIVLLVIAGALIVRMRAPAVEVEVATVTRGAMTVTIDDLAETRVRDLYTLSAPVSGELLRVPLKPGMQVAAGQTLVARLRPIAPGPLDARSFAEAEAGLRGAIARAAAAHADAQGAAAAAIAANRQMGRVSALRARGFVAQAALDDARATRDRARAALAAARSSEAAARQAQEAARAALILPDGQARGRGLVELRAPVSGAVLTVPQESMRVVAAGTPLVEIGDPAAIELVTDLLSEDAVKVREGAPVSIEDWGGPPLRGRVRLVEPYGFLKISALGVEEQRVNVIIDLVGPREEWRRLGHGFRATVRIAIWSGRDVLRLPIGALFRSGSGWSVFRAGSDGRARSVAVRLGPMNDEWAQVLGGQNAGDRVILYPGKGVADGVRIRPVR